MRTAGRVLVVCAAGLVARAASAAEYRYVEPGSEYEYAILSAPLPAEAIGTAAAEALETGRLLVSGDQGGEETRGPAPAAADAAPAEAETDAAPPPAIVWRKTGMAPFGASVGGLKRCGCSTLVADLTRERVAALYLKRTFHVGPERTQVRLLKLCARFNDGLVAYVNGVEISRRSIEPGARPESPARRTHGPEWESFYVQVPADLLVDGANTLVLEVRPTAYRLAPLIDLELVGAEQAHIVRGPIVQRVGQTTATIVFESDAPTSAEVQIGAQAGRYDRTIASRDREPDVRHAVELTGLRPGAEIHYRIVTPAEQTADLSFHTAPPPGDPIRFVLYGDVRSGHQTHAQLLTAVAGEAPDFVLSTGDMVLRGTDEADWQRFFSVAGPLLARIPVYPVIGNHDTGRAGDAQRRFEDIFALWPGPEDRPEGAAWYAFDVADLHFVMLDSNRYADARQLAWLEADLAAARERTPRAIFVATHHGPWSRGPHGGEKNAVEEYVPILRKAGVTVIFSGHDHIYQRGEVDGLPYVVSGGGGAPLYRTSCRGGRCVDDGAAVVASEHHYIALEVFDDHARMCPKRTDGTPLEECITLPLPTR